MTGEQLLDAAGARIVDRLHHGIASLIDGNHVRGAEVLNAGGRSCPCHLVYQVDWKFVPSTSQSRVVGNGAVSTHFGYQRRDYDAETAHRCEVGRTHLPIRQGFMSKVLGTGGAALAEAGRPAAIWDFGQHSVHAQCGSCSGQGEVGCGACHRSGRVSCFHCHGIGSTQQTRWVPASHGQGHGRHEVYQQTCYHCGASGRVRCGRCNGSGNLRCDPCAGHGFFTDIMSVTVQAQPHVRVTVTSALSQDPLCHYLLKLPVARVVHYLDFQQIGHQDVAADTWRVAYECHSTVVQLDLRLRAKTYMAAAVGDKALAFIRPPVFDDVFAEEITDLQKIGSAGKKAFNNRRARQFFDTYAGQPALDAAMKSVAKLKGPERANPGAKVSDACDGYISGTAADLFGRGMISLLDKVSPPNSLWSWAGVMAVPFLVLFLGAQNWLELNAPSTWSGVALVWGLVALVAVLVTALASPVAATISAVVSAIRRRAVPPAYRQHGRNWQPFKRFAWASVAISSLGAGLGLLSHHDVVPKWNNLPAETVEAVLDLHRFAPYAHASARLERAGFFRKAPTAVPGMPHAQPLIADLQSNLKRLGYLVNVTGQMDNATQRAVAAYARKRKLDKTEHRLLLASLCKDLHGACVNESQTTVP